MTEGADLVAARHNFTMSWRPPTTFEDECPQQPSYCTARLYDVVEVRKVRRRGEEWSFLWGKNWLEAGQV